MPTSARRSRSDVQSHSRPIQTLTRPSALPCSWWKALSLSATLSSLNLGKAMSLLRMARMPIVDAAEARDGRKRYMSLTVVVPDFRAAM